MTGSYHEDEVLKAFVSKTRDEAAALRFLKSLMKRHGHPKALVTDGFRSCGAALKALGAEKRQATGCWVDNRVENSHQPFRRRERGILWFRRTHSLQTFVAVHSSACNHFNSDRSPSSRNVYKAVQPTALAEWRQLCTD